MDFFALAIEVTQAKPPIRDEVAEGLAELQASLGSLADQLTKLADDLAATREETV